MLKRRQGMITDGADIGRRLLTVRRVAIIAILLLAYFYYRSAGAAQLASIGLLSFAAISQLAPAFFGGLFWKRATARGAMAGMTIGIVIWAYTLLVPSQYNENYFSIVAPATGTVMLDNTAVAGLTNFGDGSFKAGRVPVQAGAHNLVCSEGCGVRV